MRAKTYFKKHGKIYGVSSRYEFGWHHSVRIFNDFEKAIKWLHTEQYDFRERELMSRTAAIYLAGREAVEIEERYY